MESTFMQLWGRVLEETRDAAPMLVLADYLDETGTDPELAAGLRWCAAHDKWPETFGAEDVRWFYIDRDFPHHDLERYRLPEGVWKSVGGRFYQGTIVEAVRRVGKWSLTPDSQLSSMSPEGRTPTGD